MGAETSTWFFNVPQIFRAWTARTFVAAQGTRSKVFHGQFGCPALETTPGKSDKPTSRLIVTLKTPGG